MSDYAPEQAARDLRRLQLDHGQRMTPQFTVWFGRCYEEALRKDPRGSQVKRLIEDAREQLTPMAE